MAGAQVVDRERRGEPAHATRLDVHDAPGAEGDHVLGALDARDGLVEADRRPQPLLQRRVTHQVVPGERLLQHEEPELVAARQVVGVVQRVRVVRIRHEGCVVTERAAGRRDELHVGPGLDLDLDLAVA